MKTYLITFQAEMEVEAESEKEAINEFYNSVDVDVRRIMFIESDEE